MRAGGAAPGSSRVVSRKRSTSANPAQDHPTEVTLVELGNLSREGRNRSSCAHYIKCPSSVLAGFPTTIIPRLQD